MNKNQSLLGNSWIESWHVSPSLNKDYDVIDGLRGIAILMVVACHILYYDRAGSGLEQIVGGMISWSGNYGVKIFFTLSGFLISLPFWKLKNGDSSQTLPRGYFVRRFWKIYPALALSVIILTPIYVLFTGDQSYFLVAFKWLSGVPWVVPVEGKLNPVMWSLIVEVHFYVTLPFLFLITQKFNYKTTMVVLFLTLLLVPMGVRWWNATQGIESSLHPLIQTRYPSALDAFAFGVLLGGLETIRALRKSWVWLGNVGLALLILTLAVASLVGYFQIQNPIVGYESRNFMIMIASGLMILYIVEPSYLPTRLLSAHWLRWVGIISYEWYLFHQPIFRWLRKVFGPSGGNVLDYLLIVGVSALSSLLLAALIYRYFSLPILRWGRARARAKV